MKTINTDQHTAHCDVDASASLLTDLPDRLTLCSTVRGVPRQRHWYLQSGSESWHFTDAFATDVNAVEGWLRDHRYVALDTVPPGCFEYRKQ